MTVQNKSTGKAEAVLADCINGVTVSAMGGIVLLAVFTVAVLMLLCERYKGTAWRSGENMKLISNIGGLFRDSLTLHNHGPVPYSDAHISFLFFYLSTCSWPSAWHSAPVPYARILVLLAVLLWEHCLSDPRPWCQGYQVDTGMEELRVSRRNCCSPSTFS